jgi:sec-independent protein translocase protein TatA
MGLSGIGWGEVLVVLAIAVLIFGTGKLGRIGGDLGAAIRSFRSAMSDADKEPAAGSGDAKSSPEVVAHSVTLDSPVSPQDVSASASPRT